MAESRTSTRKRRPAATHRLVDARRNRILDEALDVFADYSFDGASLREIARRAEVTQPLINYHFSSKEELWRCVVDRLCAELDAEFERSQIGVAPGDEVTSMRKRIRAFITFSARRPQLNRVITGECKKPGPRMDWLIATHVGPLYRTITASMTKLIAEKAMPPIDPVHLWYILTGAGSTIFVLAAECSSLSGIDPQTDAMVEAHVDAVTALMFGDYGRPQDRP